LFDVKQILAKKILWKYLMQKSSTVPEQQDCTEKIKTLIWNEIRTNSCLFYFVAAILYIC
jgi:hypothetical protein